MREAMRREYLRFRESGMPAAHAADSARTALAWEALEAAGFVKVTAEPDDDYEWADDAERERFGDDGAWGSVGWYTLDPEDAVPEPELGRGKHDGWTLTESVWGHVGYRDVLDPAENWYVADVMDATVRAFREALKSRCPVCGRPTV
jgi:hypothetical protein